MTVNKAQGLTRPYVLLGDIEPKGSNYYAWPSRATSVSGVATTRVYSDAEFAMMKPSPDLLLENERLLNLDRENAQRHQHINDTSAVAFAAAMCWRPEL